ncbi:MAG TPA: hypothetical protein VKA30_06570 [Actinomycetota bacterium]|nr:hypothetical protein [Actinomycetota bacterium]
MASWQAEEATNQMIFREMNEWTRDQSGSADRDDRTLDSYLCECGDQRCTAPIQLTRAEYEAVRAYPTRFALALDHENPEIDSLLVENDRFATIEQSFGVAARIARDTNPRR